MSKNSSLAAICGRGDVDPLRPRAYGCYDTKVASWQMAAELQSLAVVGPTVEVTTANETLSTRHPHMLNRWQLIGRGKVSATSPILMSFVLCR